MNSSTSRLERTVLLSVLLGSRRHGSRLHCVLPARVSAVTLDSHQQCDPLDKKGFSPGSNGGRPRAGVASFSWASRCVFLCWSSCSSIAFGLGSQLWLVILRWTNLDLAKRMILWWQFPPDADPIQFFRQVGREYGLGIHVSSAPWTREEGGLQSVTPLGWSSQLHGADWNTRDCMQDSFTTKGVTTCLHTCTLYNAHLWVICKHCVDVCCTAERRVTQEHVGTCLAAMRVFSRRQLGLGGGRLMGLSLMRGQRVVYGGAYRRQKGPRERRHSDPASSVLSPGARRTQQSPKLSIFESSMD